MTRRISPWPQEHYLFLHIDRLIWYQVSVVIDLSHENSVDTSKTVCHISIRTLSIMTVSQPQLRTTEEIVALKRAEDKYARRKLVAQEYMKLVRDDLTKCYIEHGVNHLMACRELREEYGSLLKDPHRGCGTPVRDIALWVFVFSSSICYRNSIFDRQEKPYSSSHKPLQFLAKCQRCNQ